MKIWTSISAALALLTACTGSKPSSAGVQTSTFTGADSSAIAAVLDRMQTAARTGNWDAWGAEYTADAVRLPPNSPPITGKVAFDAFNRASPKFSTFDVKLTSVAGSGDVAVVSGTFAASAQAGKDPGGKATPAFRDEGSFMQALGKQSDGSWKITRDIWNSSLPTSGGAAAGSK